MLKYGAPIDDPCGLATKACFFLVINQRRSVGPPCPVQELRYSDKKLSFHDMFLRSFFRLPGFPPSQVRAMSTNPKTEIYFAQFEVSSQVCILSMHMVLPFLPSLIHKYASELTPFFCRSSTKRPSAMLSSTSSPSCPVTCSWCPSGPFPGSPTSTPMR
jgi:hypothetical protein